jgi:hypothetical protein
VPNNDAPIVRLELNEEKGDILCRNSYAIPYECFEDRQEADIEESAKVYLLGSDLDRVPDQI